MYAHFSLIPKLELTDGLTKQTAANVANLNLHGSERDHRIFNNFGNDRLCFGKVKKLLCDSINDNLYMLRNVA